MLHHGGDRRVLELPESCQVMFTSTGNRERKSLEWSLDSDSKSLLRLRIYSIVQLRFIFVFFIALALWLSCFLKSLAINPVKSREFESIKETSHSFTVVQKQDESHVERAEAASQRNGKQCEPLSPAAGKEGGSKPEDLAGLLEMPTWAVGAALRL